MAISIAYTDSTHPSRRFDGPLVRIGRSRDMDLVIPSDLCPGVSGAHAEIELRDGRAYLRDLQAANGTYLNGKRIDSECLLQSGDLVTLGANGPSLQVSLADDAPTMKAAAVPDQLDQVQPPAQKQGVGMGTMLLLLDKERSRGRRMLIVAIGLVGMLACLGLALVYLNTRQAVADTQDQIAAGSQRLEQLDATQREQENRLAELDRLQAERSHRIGELMLKLQERDEHLVALAARQDLDNQERAKLSAAIQAQRDELATQLAAAQAEQRQSVEESGTWEALVNRYESGIFLCIAADDKDGRVKIGTAFMIDERGVLATNAHVVKQLMSMPTQRVIQNKSGQIFTIKRMLAHPRFTAASSPDVGLIEIAIDDDAVVTALPLASADDLARLRIGSQLGTLGFPGELLSQYLGNIDRKARRFTGVLATYKDGWIGRYTDYKGRYQDDGANPLIQHSASLSGGTSGSPMFLRNGKVVAISSSTLTDGKAETTGPATPTSSEIAFAIRIDELQNLLAASGWLD